MVCWFLAWQKHPTLLTLLKHCSCSKAPSHHSKTFIVNLTTTGFLQHLHSQKALRQTQTLLSLYLYIYCVFIWHLSIQKTLFFSPQALRLAMGILAGLARAEVPKALEAQRVHGIFGLSCSESLVGCLGLGDFWLVVLVLRIFAWFLWNVFGIRIWDVWAGLLLH